MLNFLDHTYTMCGTMYKFYLPITVFNTWLSDPNFIDAFSKALVNTALELKKAGRVLVGHIWLVLFMA